VKARLWLTAIVLAGIGLGAMFLQLGTAVERTPSLAAPAPSQLMGAGSCAAAACHGASNHASSGGEYSIWIARDRHARAYEALFEPRSLRIQHNLHRSVAAHEDQRCLNCHVYPNLPSSPPKAPYFKTDGVSCEACHGPAQHWLAAHHLDAWKTLPMQEKQKRGMRDTQSILGRVQVCAPCHVGTPEMDVDHDLIAAGHPRLTFEFTAFHAAMPHHWPDARDRNPNVSVRGRKDFEARAWLIGQLVSTRTALELLAGRAGSEKKIWPEFAEHDCLACHHDLQASSPRQIAPSKRAAFPWSTWYLSMTPSALNLVNTEAPALDKLRKELQRRPTRNEIAQAAGEVAKQLQAILQKLEQKPGQFIQAEAVFRQFLSMHGPVPQRSADEKTQVCLTLAAMQRAQRDEMPTVPLAIPSKLLLHVPKLDANSPEPIRMRFRQMENDLRK
jgi:hypothetical protein